MKIPELAARVAQVIWWRGYYSWAYPLADRLATRWGWIARAIRWPLPWLAPWHRTELHVVRGDALGDVLLCMPALRELKRRNPACHVTFYTHLGDLVAGLPFLDRVCPVAEVPGNALYLLYEHSIPPRRHIAQVIGDNLGLNVRDVRPSCTVERELRERFQRDWSDLPRPVIVVTRRAGAWTPNKDWPDEYWDELVARLVVWATVVDLGAPPPAPVVRPTGNYIDLRGQTSLPELVAAIATADIHIAPDTGTMHIAAAVNTPAVVIYGGYIHPDSTGYPGNINLYSPVECAPCWLREPCPYGKKCLHQITPDAVQAAVNELWKVHHHDNRSPTRDDMLAPRCAT